MTYRKKCKYGCAQYGGDIGTPQEREMANMTVQRLAQKHNLIDAQNMTIGKFLPQYVDETGNQYKGMPVKQLPTTVPDYINFEDIQSEQGMNWYTDPKTGDVIDVDPTVFNLPRFKKSTKKTILDLVKRPTSDIYASLRKGGTPIMQRAGEFYEQQQREQERNNFSSQIGKIQQQVDINPIDSSAQFDTTHPNMEGWMQPQQDRILEGINKGIIQTPNG